MFFEMRFDLGSLDSGKQSLPFGLLVILFDFSPLKTGLLPLPRKIHFQSVVAKTNFANGLTKENACYAVLMQNHSEFMMKTTYFGQ